MPRICYVPKKFRHDSLVMIQYANEIIADYQSQGYSLTLRQLYYQFVSRDLIPNTQKDYKRLGTVISDARLAGLIDWYALEDRTRNLQSISTWTSPEKIVGDCARAYTEDKWADQKTRIEIWIEKDALAGVFARVADELQLPYFSCRGYTSQSEMWAAAMRLKTYERNGQNTVILHFGDHDPSGIDMTRDIKERLYLFGSDVDVRRMALTWEQIIQYAPPPNPAKLDDPRAKDYILEHGGESWELDALEPSVLANLARVETLSIRDGKLWEKALASEAERRRELKVISDNYDTVADYLTDLFSEDEDDNDD